MTYSDLSRVGKKKGQKKKKRKQLLKHNFGSKNLQTKARPAVTLELKVATGKQEVKEEQESVEGAKDKGGMIATSLTSTVNLGLIMGLNIEERRALLKQ